MSAERSWRASSASIRPHWTSCSRSWRRRSRPRGGAGRQTSLRQVRDLIAKGLLDQAADRAESCHGTRCTAACDRGAPGRHLRQAGLHGEALERYREARALVPPTRDATLGEIRALLALGRAKDAEAPLADDLAARVPRRRGRAGRSGPGAAGPGRRHQRARLRSRGPDARPGPPDLFHLQAQASVRLGDRAAAFAAFNDSALARSLTGPGLVRAGRPGRGAAQLACGSRRLRARPRPAAYLRDRRARPGRSDPPYRVPARGHPGAGTDCWRQTRTSWRP